MEKDEILKTVEGYKFLAIDHKEEQIIIVMADVENGHKGYALSHDNTGYSLNEYFIASTFIASNKETRYDFTNNLKECFDYLMGWSYIEK